MKKILSLTEKDLINVVKRITEKVNLDDYSREDFIDAFFQVFRPWIIKKLGDDAKKYPMSWLLKKYGQQFAEEKGLIERGSSRNFNSSFYSLQDYGKELVIRSHYELPQLYQQEKFTDKYKKILPHLIERLNLPPFIDINFIEDSPNRVYVKYDVDFDEWMKYPEEFELDEYNLSRKFKDLLANFAGVEFGNPAHGEVEMQQVRTTDYNSENWVKNFLNKIIKKEIRKVDGAESIHSIKFSPNSSGGLIVLVFKNDWKYSSINRNNVVKEAREVVYSLGYGPNLTVRW